LVTVQTHTHTQTKFGSQKKFGSS